MNIRILILTYLAAWMAGAIFKTVQYWIQPESMAGFNAIVIELTIVSAIVTFGVSLFYMFRQNKNTEHKE